MQKPFISLTFFLGISLVFGVFSLRTTTQGAAIAAPSVALFQDLQNRMAQGSTTRLLKKISYNPNHVLKMKGHEVRHVFQEPELVRKDSPATVWQYRTASCVLDIYFLTDQKNADFSPVAHYEIRARKKEATNLDISQKCVQNLMVERKRPHMVGVSKFYKAL